MEQHDAAKALSARDRIARLRETFVSQLPQRLQQLREASGQQDASPAMLAALHRQFHSLKGTGRSFGLVALGNAASVGEDLLAAALEQPMQAQQEAWQAQVRAAVEGVAAAVAQLQTDTGAPPEASLPSFALPPRNPEDRDEGHLIYLCDDEELPLQQLSDQLECFGYRTRSFTDTDALKAAVRERSPDAVIMDIHFPEGVMAGTETMTALRTAGKADMPAIFLSGRDDLNARLAAVQAGGNAYFHKPANTLELVSALDTLTGRQEAQPYRVLVIDDEVEVAAYHRVLLEEAGMQVGVVTDPQRLFEALRELQPDIVLMDMYMPGCNGRHLASVIRQIPEYVGLPIVYLSSETDRRKQFSAMRVGAEGFLTKPVAPEELVSAVAIRAERMRSLRALMVRDSLTGLLNHTATTQFLDKAVANARRRKGTLCFAMIDVDHFKVVNDRHGHPVGDQVLLAIARVLRQRLRRSDTVGRYGGEEFAVILEDAEPHAAFELIDGLRRDFSRIVFHGRDATLQCTFSAGIASFPQLASAEALREAADRALYQAKALGRNCVCASTESLLVAAEQQA